MQSAHDEWIVCACTGYYGRAQAQANARLIAAAPELYEALSDAVQYLRHHLPNELLAPHLAALAKARGAA